MATNADIAKIKADIAEIKADSRTIKWMLGLLLVLDVAKLLFVVNLSFRFI